MNMKDLPRGNQRDQPGRLLTRMAMAHMLSASKDRSLAAITREYFGADVQLVEVMKAASGTADTTTAGWAAELVRTDVQAFLDSLASQSVYAALALLSLRVDFGEAGAVRVPFASGTNDELAGAFVGEGGGIPVKRGMLASSTLRRYKLAVISALAEELTRASPTNSESIVRAIIDRDTARTLDGVFLDALPEAQGVRPAGILNGVTALSASTAPNRADAAAEDLQALVAALIAAGNGVRPVFLMNTAQALFVKLRLPGVTEIEIASSANVTPGRIIAVDAANFATGLGTPELDASRDAVLVMADAGATAPTHATLASDPTAIGTVDQVPPDGGLQVSNAAQYALGKVGEGATAVSMYQQWAIALRTILPVSWATLRAGSVQWIDTVTW